MSTPNMTDATQDVAGLAIAGETADDSAPVIYRRLIDDLKDPAGAPCVVQSDADGRLLNIIDESHDDYEAEVALAEREKKERRDSVRNARVESAYIRELIDENKAVAATPDPRAPLALQTGAKGKPLSNVKNAVTVLAVQTALLVAYDEFQGKALVRWPDDNTLRPMTDEDITRVRIELQGKFGMDQTSAETAYAALRFVAKRNTVNCVADWLNSLPWDGTRRLSMLMPHGFGTTSERYHLRAGRNMIIAMVARAMRPGCKVDEAVVLEGPQGTLKSSALGVIGGEFFKELTAHPNSKDFEQQLVGVWLGEFPELNALRRVEDIGRIKQFITCQEDHLRLPYDRTVSDLPRRVVLCGSTNEESWLHDTTGGRRFIPVQVGKINLQWLRDNREQLFAEAVALYKAGRKWWIYPKEDTLARQEERTTEDPWTSKVRNYLCGRAEINPSELLDWVLAIPIERQNKSHSTRAGVTLRQLGCIQQGRRRVDGVRQRLWTVPEEFASKPVTVPGPVQFQPVQADDHSDLTSGGDV